MRNVSYAEIAPNNERIGIVDTSLIDFLLDIPYLLSSHCIPPLQVMNEVLAALTPGFYPQSTQKRIDRNQCSHQCVSLK